MSNDHEKRKEVSRADKERLRLDLSAELPELRDFSFVRRFVYLAVITMLIATVHDSRRNSLRFWA